ncbi:MAG: hypothetical protein AAF222_00475 [Pseudomonadota bacterium]
MAASFEAAPAPNSAEHIFEALSQNNSAGPRQSFASGDAADPIAAAWRTPEIQNYFLTALRLVQDRADIDVSGPEFNFVRSIRVFDVRYARQHESGRDGDCNRSATVVLGTYGTQGDFSWRRSSIAALPKEHVGLERWGYNCPNVAHRSIFVDWRDYEGSYGFEQVEY